MTRTVPRRDVLKQLGLAGAGLAVSGRFIGAQPNDIVVAGQPVQIDVASLSPATIRISVLPLDDSRPAPVPLPVPGDGALVVERPGRVVATRRAADAFPPVRAGNLTVRFTADPPMLIVETAGRDPGRSPGSHTLQRLTFSRESPGMSFLLSKGPLLGLGQGGPQFDRRGSTDQMRSGQGGYQLRTHGGRVPIQWLVGTDGWAMFIHQPLGTFDFTGEDGRFTPASAALPLDVFVVASRDPKTIMAEYARITGHPEMPALWTFGYLQSHRTLEGADDVRRVARTMREKKLPCDALIYLGTEFTPSGWNTRNGEFTWKAENFPDPKAMIDELHAQHFRVVLHTVIEGRRLTGVVTDTCASPEPSGRDAANRWPADRTAGCYWPHHKGVFDLGIDGWWPDQGDGYDGPSRLRRIRMYWEGTRQWRPNERPFALHRNGYAGMARYGAFLWSGDVQSLWETLKTHVPVAINTGLSGIPFWGTDIGGFVPTAEYTGELYVRWFQFGAFCPLFRSHGRQWRLHTPFGWTDGELGPIETASYKPDPATLRNPAVEPICRKYLELRYRLLPYLYTAVRECCDTGMPIVRALWLHDAEDAVAAARGDEYLWGRDMLVAPVTEPSATSRRVYLPRGPWYDFWTEQRHEGGREIERQVDLETMPLYVRAGAIVPLAPVRQYTDEQVEGPLTLVVYPGADGASSLYEDDGHTFAYRTGDWMRLEIAWRDADRRLTMRLAPGSRMRPPRERPIELRIAGGAATKRVAFSGRTLQVKL